LKSNDLDINRCRTRSSGPPQSVARIFYRNRISAGFLSEYYTSLSLL